MPVLLAILHFHLRTFWMSQIPSTFHQNSTKIPSFQVGTGMNRAWTEHVQSVFASINLIQNAERFYDFRIVSPAMPARELNVVPEDARPGGYWRVAVDSLKDGPDLVEVATWWPLQQGRLVIELVTYFYSDLTATSQKIILSKRNYPSKISHCILCPVGYVWKWGIPPMK